MSERSKRERERVRRNHVGLREDGLIWARARGIASARVRASGLKECVKNRTNQGLFQYQLKCSSYHLTTLRLYIS